MERVLPRRLYPELIARGGEINKFIDHMGKRGVTHLALLNGNCATHYPEMFNNMVGTAQAQIDRIRTQSPDAVIGIGFNSDTDALLGREINTALHPSVTGMDEITRASYVLDALHAQFNERADGKNIPVASYLYEGDPATRDSGVEELHAIKSAGFKTFGSKSWPWAPKKIDPFASKVWFATEVDEYVTIVSPDGTQGSIMEAFDRERRISEIGENVTLEATQAVVDLVASGKVINLYDRDAIVTYKVKGEVTPILDLDGQLMIIKPQGYMTGDKPHYPLYETQEALRSVPHFKFLDQEPA